MKKILLSITISTLGFSTLSYADLNLRFSIPQPNFVSNDWDNDGQPNEIDPDDDNDGLNDTEDSIPFGRGGQSSVPNVIVNSFTANPISFFPNSNVTLNWNVDNIRSLNLYDDALLTNHLDDVTNQNSISVSPTGDMTYYLDTETGVSQVSVFEYQETSRTCGSWSPDPNTVSQGNSFQQSRLCNVNYSSNEPASETRTENEFQNNTGTKLTDYNLMADTSLANISIYKDSKKDNTYTDNFISNFSVNAPRNVRLNLRIEFDKPVRPKDVSLRGTGAFGLFCRSYVNTAKPASLQDRSSCISESSSRYNIRLYNYRNAENSTGYPKSRVWWFMPHSGSQSWRATSLKFE